MARLLIYYAHPAHGTSRVNAEMAAAAEATAGVEFLDLYRAYPRQDIRIDVEQERIQAADVILFQFPLFWYSTPSIVKEWLDLVLEHGFAYGEGGDRLAGKSMMLAITAGAPRDAYGPEGYQHFPLRTFLTPLEQTARLCRMRFLAPYVLFGAITAPEMGVVAPHVAGYRRLLAAIRDDGYDLEAAATMAFVTHDALPTLSGER